MLHDNRKPDVQQASGEEDDESNMAGLTFSVTGAMASLSLFLGSFVYYIYISGEGGGEVMSFLPWLLFGFGSFLLMFIFLSLQSFKKTKMRLDKVETLLAQKDYELAHHIAGRKETQRLAQEATEEYQLILNNINDVVFEADIEGHLIFINQSWAAMSGFPVAESLGKKLLTFFHKDDWAAIEKKIEGLLRGDIDDSLLVPRLLRNNQRERKVRLNMKILRQDRAQALQIVGVISDIQGGRQIETVLREAEEKYRAIVENAVGGIYQVTPEGRCVSANPALATMLDYDSTEQLLTEMSDVSKRLYVSVADRYRFLRSLEKNGVVRNFETQVRKRGGETIWVNESARVVYNEEGNILYFEGSMEDISARKMFETELREAKINSDLSNRAKSEFLANMSHELRTPLNAIIGFSEIIKGEMLGAVEQKQYLDYASDIYHSGQNLLKIINEILDVVQIDSGDRQLQESVVDLNELIQKSVRRLHDKAHEEKISIYNKVSSAIPPLVADRLALKQILNNVLSNAIKFTPEGGNITISHEIRKSGRLRLSITDTGIGMDEYELEKALSPFGQAEGNLNKKNSGTGLGLTLVHALMKLHEGDLEMFSQKGLGTKVTLVFPARRMVDQQGRADGAAPDSNPVVPSVQDMTGGQTRKRSEPRITDEPPSPEIH